MRTGSEHSEKIVKLLLTLSMILVSAGCSDLSSQVFERSQVGYFYGKAITNLKEHNYKQTTSGLTEGLRKYRNSGLYILRGQSQLKTGDFAEAVDDFNMAFKYRKTEKFNIASINRHLSKMQYYRESFIYANRGLAFHYLQEPEKATDDINNAIKLDPDCPTWYCYRALVKKQLLDRDEALKDLDRAIALNKKSSLPYHIRATIYEDMEDKTRSLEDKQLAKKLGYQKENDPTRYNIEEAP